LASFKPLFPFVREETRKRWRTRIGPSAHIPVNGGIPVTRSAKQEGTGRYAYMGRLDEAREVFKRLQTITPAVEPRAGVLRKAEHRELYLPGLRLAAGEAT
jgi:hypothetical protein